MKYTGENLREISFPLGGIGTGCIGFAGNGRLIDWEIFNHPNKGSLNGYTHIAVRAELPDGSIRPRVLNGDLQKDLMGQYSKAGNTGYGFGPSSCTMCGFPHFRDSDFVGEFPIADLHFNDPHFPGEVLLTAFNPLIPLDDKNSSLPAAFFEIRFTNPTEAPIRYSAAFSLMNPFSHSRNVPASNQLRFLTAEGDPSDLDWGDLTLACAGGDVQIQPYWYRGGWQDGIATFWREFSERPALRPREYAEPGRQDMGTVMASAVLQPGESKSVRFVLAWNVPNRQNDWSPMEADDPTPNRWKNYYASLFPDSGAAAAYCLERWDSLYAQTDAFRRALFTSTLDPAVIDAASATLSVLKSPTVLRLEDGSFYGWEGVNELTGSCEGTCSHVWNYAYALCFLFPQLERSIRELEFTYNTYGTGEMDFRLKLPLGRRKGKFRACVDGQMGSVIKSYREWKLSGDTEWLRKNWPALRKILGYAWSEDNADQWDRDKDGVLEGRQHHTLDMELFGPSSWLEGFYLAALKAGAEMAEALGFPEEAREYRALFEKGSAWTRENLFNGSYFIQKVDLEDKSILDRFGCADAYWNDEAGELKYQIGEGCEIDQLCAQWHAHICGLGQIFDPEQVKTALKNLWKNNFKSEGVREFANPWRIFCLNDEKGAVICDYPEGSRKPVIPIPYCEEAMHGFEYQLAGLMIGEGMIPEGIAIVRAVRERYDGRKRNPWNEIECGGNYARSMASFALLPLFSGFTFDLTRKQLGFAPRTEKPFRCLWSVGTGWGVFLAEQDAFTLELAGGSLELSRLTVPPMGEVHSVCADGLPAAFRMEGDAICFDPPLAIRKSVAIR